MALSTSLHGFQCYYLKVNHSFVHMIAFISLFIGQIRNSPMLPTHKKHFSPGKVCKCLIKYMFYISYFNLIIAWDLLRIDVYGFKAFCKYFFERYPGYFIAPLRISGSAVESLFSQFKHNSGGKLDACNYATARCAHLVKQSASGHHSGAGYRDQTLSFMEIPLRKKEYGTT